jgi:cytochrome c2
MNVYADLRHPRNAWPVTWVAALAALTALTAAAADEIATAKYRWAQSPYGAMLERILPPSVEPANLPEPASPGARLAVAYCVQCHHLPNPAMHDVAKWPHVVERMVWRMEGRGNMGKLMQDMMNDIKTPDADERSALVRYLQKHAQRALDPARYADMHSTAGRRFSIACSQCHALPDPQRHTAGDWPAVVERMRRNMAWANRVTGDPLLRTSPELDTADIVRFLQRHARPR